MESQLYRCNINLVIPYYMVVYINLLYVYHRIIDVYMEVEYTKF